MRLYIFIICLILFSCKESNKTNQEALKESNSKVSIVNTTFSKKVKEDDTKSFEIRNTQWVEVEKVGGQFKPLNNEWKRKIEVRENEILVELMEPSTYDIGSIIEKDNQFLFKIKGVEWYYKFKWEDKDKHICRWDYIYETKIDSSFSYYTISKNHENQLK